MKIIYLFNGRFPTEKAYGIQIAKMCEAFALEGLDATLVYPFRKNQEKGDIFSYYSLEHNFKTKEVESIDFYWPGFLDKISFLVKNYFSAKALVAEALKENVDVYYTRDELAAYLLSKKNKNVIFECHRFSNKRKLFYWYFKKKNLKVVVISEGLREDLLKNGFKDSNILIARDGVDLKEFNSNLSQIDARKKLYGNLHKEAFERKKIAVYVGQLYSWKGVNIFSETAKYLCDKNANYLLFVFGGTDVKDPKVLKKELENIETNRHPNFVPIFGRYPHQAVPDILKSADCAILTGNESEIISAKYTSPLKMFEYMASGCPIIVQDLPSFREVLNDENAFWVQPGNAQALADKIAWVFKEENKIVAIGKAAKAIEDVKSYTWQKRASNIVKFIESA